MSFQMESIDPSQYMASDLDEAGATKYYGFVDIMGNWYIQSVTSTAIRFTMGNQGYPAAWTGRAGLTYTYFYLAKTIT